MTFFYRLCRFIAASFLKLFFGFKVRGEDNIPREGRVILASNHVSALDPPIVGVATKRELHFLAKKELFSVPIIGAMIKRLNSIPIERGAGDIKAIKAFTQILQNDQAALLFPEGTRSRDGGFGEAREGVGLIATRTKSDIIPIYIKGTWDLKRSFLRRGGISVYFGTCVKIDQYKDLDLPKKERYKKISQDVLDAIKRLKDSNSG